MHRSLLDILRCPATGEKLRLANATTDDVIERATLVAEKSGHSYPVERGVPRFVSSENYADNFGMQWNLFRKTQLDSHSGHPISADRFWKATGWQPPQIKDKLVLDGGCGAGRFAEIAASTGARVVAIDYSSAVDACQANLGQLPNVDVVQADIYSLPFAPQTFPFVYSLGVLQHTPDVRLAFRKLVNVLAPGGSIAVDFYWKRVRSILQPKYLLRPVTKRVGQQKLISMLERSVPAMLTVSQNAKRIPVVGKALSKLVPVADYSGIYPLNQQQLREWALLDTFDMFAPKYDKPQTVSTVRRWFAEEGLGQVEVLHASALAARGTRPA